MRFAFVGGLDVPDWVRALRHALASQRPVVPLPSHAAASSRGLRAPSPRAAALANVRPLEDVGRQVQGAVQAGTDAGERRSRG
jgi:hypothetical protein